MSFKTVLLIILIFRYINKNQWLDGLYLCRGADDAALWVCLAVLAMQSGTDHLDTLEEAFAFINQYDKVYYLQQMKVKERNKKTDMIIIEYCVI